MATFFDLVTSPWTLVPALAGVSALVVGWAIDRGDVMPYCYYAAGAGGALALAILLTRWLAGGAARVNPEAERLRRQVLDSLETSVSGPRKQAQKAQSAGTPAALERG